MNRFLFLALLVVIQTLGLSYSFGATSLCTNSLLQASQSTATAMLNTASPNIDFRYKEGACYSNICSLIDHVSALGYDMSKVRILYISKKNTPITPLIPATIKNNPPKLWSYHVVMLYEGQVIDMDFPDGPTPIAVQDYFLQMFGEKLTNVDDLVVSALPIQLVNDYRKHFPKTYPLHLRQLSPYFKHLYGVNLQSEWGIDQALLNQYRDEILNTPTQNSSSEQSQPKRTLPDFTSKNVIEEDEITRIKHWNRNFELALRGHEASSQEHINIQVYSDEQTSILTKEAWGSENLATTTLDGKIYDIGKDAFTLSTPKGLISIPFYALAEINLPPPRQN